MGLVGQKVSWAALFSVAMLSGCADDQQATRASGAGLGAALGCGIGALITGDASGCAIGALAGGTGGFLVGNEVADRKQQYASMEDLLDGEIAKTEETNRALVRRNRQLRDDLQTRQATLVALESDVAASQATERRKQAEVTKIKKESAEAQQLLEDARQELAIQQELLEETEKEIAQSAEVGVYRQKVAAMERHIVELSQLVEQYAAVDDRISAI